MPGASESVNRLRWSYRCPFTPVFDALAEGGQVTQDLIETFLSSAFGMCVDRFGIPWMINTDQPQQ